MIFSLLFLNKICSGNCFSQKSRTRQPTNVVKNSRKRNPKLIKECTPENVSNATEGKISRAYANLQEEPPIIDLNKVRKQQIQHVEEFFEEFNLLYKLLEDRYNNQQEIKDIIAHLRYKMEIIEDKASMLSSHNEARKAESCLNNITRGILGHEYILGAGLSADAKILQKHLFRTYQNLSTAKLVTNTKLEIPLTRKKKYKKIPYSVEIKRKHSARKFEKAFKEHFLQKKTIRLS